MAVASAIGALCATVPASADTWLKAESEHFIVYSNDSEGYTVRYISDLEKYRYTLVKLYQAATGFEKASAKFEVFLLRSRESFKEVWPTVGENVAGFYSHCQEGAIAFSGTDLRGVMGSNSNSAHRLTRGQVDNAIDREILFHEYAHHVMFDTFATAYPAWFVEGFAEYYSTIRFTGGNAVTIGAPTAMALDHLSDAKWIDFADLLKGERKSYNASTFYSQSWLLTHYILSDPQRTAAFTRYVDAHNSGEPADKAFEAQFGIKVADLEKILKAYMSKGTSLSFRFNAMPETKVTPVRLPKSADKLLLWQATLKTCPRESYKAELLQQIRSEAPLHGNDPLAELTLARAEILLGERERAAPLLASLKTRLPDNAEVHYLSGRYHLDRARAERATSAENAAIQYRLARQAFDAAYRIEPLSGPLMYRLAQAQENRTDFPNATAQNAAVQAATLVPSSDEYAFYAAWVLINADRHEEAGILLAPVGNNPHGGGAAARAKLMVEMLKSGATKAQLLAMLNADVKAEEEEDDD